MSDHGNVLEQARKQGHNEVIGLLTNAAQHAHKGPNDTDASMLREAAIRLRGGYEPGGSNTKQMLARVADLVADLIEDDRRSWDGIQTGESGA